MQTRHVLSSRKIIAYKVYRGDYAKIYQTFAPIMRLAPYSDTIGIYYDNSGTVARTRRRYAVGVVVERCGSRMSVEELVRLLESKGFKFFCLEGFVLEGRGNSNIRLTPMVKAVFPIKSRLGSTIATIRVYPKLRQFIQSHRLDAKLLIEYYCRKSREMHYLVPCKNNSRYYVPEYSERNEKYGSESYEDLVYREN
ncbi:testis-expressed protein 264 homolog [Convolutriloba macropyga]|uniref:testis-expressed protein 264 homolog n=1 Tax=Convolutriloba macropyga TaxID=536237 RepID=UPI003F525186